MVKTVKKKSYSDPVATINPLVVWCQANVEDVGRLVRFKNRPEHKYRYGILNDVRAPTEYFPRLYAAQTHEGGFSEHYEICEVQDMDVVSYAVFTQTDGATHTIMSFNGMPCCEVITPHTDYAGKSISTYVFNRKNATKATWRVLGGKEAGIKKEAPPNKGIYYVTSDPDHALSMCRELYNMDFKLNTGMPG